MIRMLSVLDIATDADCQPRVAIDQMVVNDYADEMAGGADFPPLTVYSDGNAYWLADGFHRLLGARKLGLAEISCDVRHGDKRDAILYAVGANSGHGLRRTNADKRRAIETLLSDPEWSGWSDSEIARRCCATQPTVGSIRLSLIKFISDTASERTYVNKAGETATMNVANIGKGRAALPVAPPPVQTLPTRVSAEHAVALFGDVETDVEDDPITPAFDWKMDDGKLFAKIIDTLPMLAVDPKAVAYAAVVLNPAGAANLIHRANEYAIWQSRFINELRALL